MPISVEKLERVRRKIGRMFKSEVPDTSELRRIHALPRRNWKTEIVEGVGDLEAITEAVTALLKTPNGTQRLFTHQAKVIQELMDLGYVVAELDVGDGKTLISFLAAVVLEVERPLVIVPSKLEKKTGRDFEALRVDWKAPAVPIEITVFELLSRDGGAAILERINPDALIVDEVHRLKNPDAAVTRKIDNWMALHPRTRFVPLTATFMNRSIYECEHIYRWTVPADRMPLPESEIELAAWAAAIDEIKTGEDRAPGSPGALKLFCNEDEKKDGRRGIRRAYGRRIQETPGFIATEGSGCKAALNIELTLVDGYNDKTLELAQGLLNDVKPNGDPITDNDLGYRWQLFRQITSGFWYERNPPPPAEWLKRKRLWLGKCRRILDLHADGLESQMLVARAAKLGKLDAETNKAYAKWKEIEPSYKDKHKRPVWVDDRMIRFVRDWTKKNKGIIWVNEIALGDRLSEELGLSYFHEKGLDSSGKFIDDADNDRCIIASVESNSEGRNLQHKWSKGLVISCMPSGKAWQQLLGRKHRNFQKADEVWFEVAISCLVEWECWRQALRDLDCAGAVGKQKKLQIATITPFDPPYRSNALWN